MSGWEIAGIVVCVLMGLSFVSALVGSLRESRRLHEAARRSLEEGEE